MSKFLRQNLVLCVVVVPWILAACGDHNAKRQVDPSEKGSTPVATVAPDPIKIGFLKIAPPIISEKGAITPMIATSGLFLSYEHAMAVRSDGVLMAWGNNEKGQLGNGSLNNSLSPVQVSVLAGQKIKNLAAGLHYSFAVTEDGKLWAWGNNSLGQLGDGTTVNRTIPTRIGAGVLPPVTSVTTLMPSYTTAQTYVTTGDGSVWAWGINTGGQLGNGLNTSTLVPVKVSFPSGVSITQVVTGRSFVMALSSTGSVYVWGSNASGQFADGTIVPTTGAKSMVPVLIASVTGVKKLAAHSSTGFALKSDGTVWSWGLNGSSGLAGIGSTDARIAVPTQITGLANYSIVDIAAAGTAATLALTSSGNVLGWGNNIRGQLGVNVPGTSSAYTAPILIKGTGGEGILSNIVAIGANIMGEQAFAQKSDGTLLAWGSNELGQLGNGEWWATNTPGVIPTLSKLANPGVKSLFVVGAEAFVLMTDGTVQAWGFNSWGNLGLGFASNENVSSPTKVTALSNIITLAGGHCEGTHFALAVDNTGQVWSWGFDAAGMLGIGSKKAVRELKPVKVHGVGDVGFLNIGTENIALSVGNCHVLALKSDGTVLAWGAGADGQLGLGPNLAPAIQSTPAPVMDVTGLAPIKGVKAIAAANANNTSYIIQGDNYALLAFGNNVAGTLGINSLTPTQKNIPVPVLDVDGKSPLTGIRAVAGGYFKSGGQSGNFRVSPGTLSFAVALKQDGSVLSWGSNDYGSLGNGTTVASLIPVQVTGLGPGSGVTSIHAGSGFVIARKGNGALLSWGWNFYGGLGDGTYQSRLTPNEIPNFGSGNGIAAIATNGDSSFALAIKNEGDSSTVLSWGANDFEQLGTGPRKVTAYPSTPIQQRVYIFNGYLKPIDNLGQTVFSVGSEIPITFKLNYADCIDAAFSPYCNGQGVQTAKASLQVFKVVNAEKGELLEIPATSSIPFSNSFAYAPSHGTYYFYLNTKGYTPGRYLLRTTLNDSTTHSVEVTLTN